MAVTRSRDQVVCSLCCLFVMCLSLIQALPPFLTNFQEPYPEDFTAMLRQARRNSDPSYFSGYNKGEHSKHEGDLRVRYGLTPDFYDLDPRSEYVENSLVKALNGEQMRVTGGNGALGAYNQFPSSVVPGHTEKTDASQHHVAQPNRDEIIREIDQELAEAMQSGGAGSSSEGSSGGDINPYPTPPNPCPLPYPDEEGRVNVFSTAEGCIPKWADDAELSRWYQNQQTGKSDNEHNQGVDKGHVKKSVESLPAYMKVHEKRESIRAKKGK